MKLWPRLAQSQQHWALLTDRYAITRQWFTIYLSNGDKPDLT